jgi:hypothetical protein
VGFFDILRRFLRGADAFGELEDACAVETTMVVEVEEYEPASDLSTSVLEKTWERIRFSHVQRGGQADQLQ